MAHFACQLLNILTDCIKIIHSTTEKVFSGRAVGLQGGTGTITGSERFTSRQRESETGSVLYIAANQSGERGKEPQMAALAEVSGATRLHASLLLVTLAGMTHMPSLRLCCTTHTLCPSPVLWVCARGNKSQNRSTELETSLLCSTKYEIEIACIISLHFEGLCRQLTVAEISDIFSCMHRGCERTLQEHNRYIAHIEMANVKAHRHDSYTASPDTPWMCESSAQAHFWQAYVLSQARLVNAPVCLKLIRN